MANRRPNPDDRSDNVEKLQNMIHNTIENMDRAEEAMETASPEQREQIAIKNEHRRESLASMRREVKDEYRHQQSLE